MSAQGLSEQIMKLVGELEAAREEERNARERLALVRETIARAEQKVRAKQRELLLLIHGRTVRRTDPTAKPTREPRLMPNSRAMLTLRDLYAHSGTPRRLRELVAAQRCVGTGVSEALARLAHMGLAIRDERGWCISEEGRRWYERHNPGLPEVTQ